MMKQQGPDEQPDATSNRLLSLLNPRDLAAVVSQSSLVTLKFRQALVRQDEPICGVYFPLTCMVSLIVTTDGEPQMEMATVGREGVVGAAELLNQQPSMAFNLVQIPGRALRIAPAPFAQLSGTCPAVLKLILQHQHALTRQILFGAACNRLHGMEERCARWLLMTHDRAGQDTFPLTQEFLSRMLGVRRATVNLATGMLKKAGLIRYVRGNLTVTDRTGLESTACSCYEQIVRVYDSALRPQSDGKPRAS